MIRINLVRSRGGTGAKPAKALVSPREAITGAVLLAAAFGMLFYLASRQKPAAAPEPPPKIVKAEQVVKAPPPAPRPEPQVETPPPKVAATPPVARAEVPPVSIPATPTTGCQVTEISVQKSGGTVTVVLRASAEVKYTSFELFKPDRIAVDVAGCKGAVPRAQASQAVEDPVVQRVRANQFRADLYRVVLDVSAMPRYQIRSIDKGLEIRVLGKKP